MVTKIVTNVHFFNLNRKIIIEPKLNHILLVHIYLHIQQRHPQKSCRNVLASLDQSHWRDGIHLLSWRSSEGWCTNWRGGQSERRLACCGFCCIFLREYRHLQDKVEYRKLFHRWSSKFTVEVYSNLIQNVCTCFEKERAIDFVFLSSKYTGQIFCHLWLKDCHSNKMRFLK